eukprot:2423132-Amphidinium_carterae.1
MSPTNQGWSSRTCGLYDSGAIPIIDGGPTPLTGRDQAAWATDTTVQDGPKHKLVPESPCAQRLAAALSRQHSSYRQAHRIIRWALLTVPILLRLH